MRGAGCKAVSIVCIEVSVLLVWGVVSFAQTRSPTIRTVPEFFFPEIRVAQDTMFSMKCYDGKNKLLLIWDSFAQVRFVSVIRTYQDPKNMYTDSVGKLQPLPISSIVVRYDRLGNNKWMKVDYRNSKYTTLTEYPDILVRTDTLWQEVGEPIVLKYYKVQP